MVGDYDNEAPYVDMRSRFTEFVVYSNGADSAVTVVSLCVDQIGDITIHARQGSEVAAGYVPLFVNNGCFDFHVVYTARNYESFSRGTNDPGSKLRFVLQRVCV